MSTVGTFFGLNIATSALVASQSEIDVAGNNISNANTTGYSDESATLVQGIPVSGVTGSATRLPAQFGSGVVVSQISRARDQFLDASYRAANSQQNNDQSLNTALTTVQTSFNEPGNNGINNALSTFFNGMSNVENSPSDLGVRAAAIGDAGSLARIFNTTANNLATTQVQLTTETTQAVAQLNTYGQQLASLNGQIRMATAQGQQPNALLDQRDNLLDGMSGLTNITARTNSDGTVNVSIGSTNFVTGLTSSTLNLASLQANGDVTEGTLAGLGQAQADLTSYQASLDTVASQVITQVNTIQEGGAGLDGSTGIPLFNGTDASSMSVNQAVVNSPEKLAAAAATTPAGTVPAPGDGSNAALIANLSTQALTTGPLTGQTIQNYYTGMITTLATNVSNSGANAMTEAATVKQLQNQRSAVSGVNIDQEMTNMLEFQRSYQAAAQLISTQDQMLGTLINDVFQTS